MKKLQPLTINSYFVLFLSMFFTSNLRSEMLVINYRIERSESFADIYRKFVRDGSIIHARTPMVKKTINANPHIKDWQNLPYNQYIHLYLSREFIHAGRFNAYLNFARSRSLRERSLIARPYQIDFSFFTSQVSFENESSKGDSSISGNYNDLFNVEINSAVKPTIYNFRLGLDLRLSAPGKRIFPEVIEENESFSFSYHGNLLLHYYLQNEKVSFALSIGQEYYELFNLENLILEDVLFIERVNSSFIGIGSYAQFSLYNRIMLLNINYSRSLSSQREFSTLIDDNANDSLTYQKSRIEVDLRAEWSTHYFLRIFYNKQNINGPSKWDIHQFGIGMTYNLWP